MEVTGTIASRKISANDFLYWWCIPEFLVGYSYRSPKFDSICEEFSDCYLEIKTHIGPQQISRFFLCCSKDQSESKFSFSADLEHGVYPKPKGIYSAQCYDLKSYVKIFAMDCSLYEFNPYFIFKLNLKLFKDLTAASSFPNNNVLLRSIEEKSVHRHPTNEEPILKDNDETKVNGIIPSNSSKVNPKYDQLIEYPKELIEDLRTLYTSGAMSDLEIRIGEHIIRAHKSILCARSPVIQRMMENNCLESSTNTINIADCSVLLFEKFILYIYTGELEDRTLDTVMALYTLGDKYDVPALREVCSNILQDKLSSEPVEDIASIVCDILKLAELTDLKLKDLAKSFIVTNFQVVSNTQSWKDLINSDFELTSEILALVVSACQKIQA